MKKVTFAAVALALGVSLASTAQAADPPRRVAMDMYVDVKDLVGMRVVTPDGKHVGEIDHTMVNANGKVTHVVVGLGGLAGVGERHVVVPWSKVTVTRNPRDPNDPKDMLATIDRATLESAPRYTRDRDRPAASPSTRPFGDRDNDGVRNNLDRAPNNPRKY